MYISALVRYGLEKRLIEPCDVTFITNQLLMEMGLDHHEPQEAGELSLEEILGGLLEDAVARGVCQDDITSRDLFDTRLMGVLTPLPRESMTSIWAGSSTWATTALRPTRASTTPSGTA